MEVKDYLPLYLGCYVMYKGDRYAFIAYNNAVEEATLDLVEGLGKIINVCKSISEVKLLLRPLSDMTEGERADLHWRNASPFLNDWIPQNKAGITTKEFHYLLSKHFDLFGLIDAGLALDKTKQQ